MSFSGIFVLLAAMMFPVLSTQVETGTLVIKVNGFESDKGKARFLLFSEADQDYFPKDPVRAYKTHVMPIKNGSVVFQWKDIPHGKYAVAVHHDENDDQKMNTNWVGIPNEGFGASNNAEGLFGPPSFEDAVFTLDKAKLTVAFDIVN